MFSRFGTLLKNMPFNEQFGDQRPLDSKWPAPSPISSSSSNLETAGFFDKIGPCEADPPSQLPGSASLTKVFEIDQSYRAGSGIIGMGVLFQTDTLQYFLDHAVQANVVSPVPR